MSTPASIEGAVTRPGGRVYELLKMRLLNGRYRGGERLNAAEIAAELGVSKQPVFDSFKRLSTEGFLVVTPHVGCRVVTSDPQQVRDYFWMFAALEGSACALAARRRSDRDLRALRRLHVQIGGLIELRDSDERAQGYRMLNRDFHSMVHAMCRSEIVVTTASSMFDRADFFINGATRTSPLADRLPDRQEGHAELVAALESGDPEQARSAGSAHILGTVDLIEAAIATEAGQTADTLSYRGTPASVSRRRR